MPRIFLPLGENPRTVRISGEKARYLVAVLRCEKGEDLEILDGKGHSFSARIVSLTRQEVLAQVTGVGRRDTESPVPLTLIQGMLKGEKMELVIQKTTELGVREIFPVVTERSQVRQTRKTGRWRKIAEDASRQCGRTAVPVIHEPVPFLSLFSAAPESAPSPGKSSGLLFWEEGGIPLKEVRSRLGECLSVALAIGPEGGFTKGEVNRAESEGFIPVSLGNRILRAETASISATALVQFLFGDLGRG